LSYAALLLAGGALVDLWGRKKVMILGLIIFALSSGVCGLANSSVLLNLARAVQGIGGSLLLTAALASGQYPDLFRFSSRVNHSSPVRWFADLFGGIRLR
jgi:MFS family permease